MIACIALGLALVTALGNKPTSITPSSDSARDTSRASADWAALEALRVQYDPADTVWPYRAMELQQRLYRTQGITFFHAYPHDPRRWQWLLNAELDPPLYYADRAQAVRMYRADSINEISVDTAARHSWDRAYAGIRAEFFASPEVTADQRQALRYAALWTTLRDAMRALMMNDPAAMVVAQGFMDSVLVLANQTPVHGGAVQMAGFVFTEPAFRRLDRRLVLQFIANLKASKNAEVQTLANGKELLVTMGDTPLDMQFRALDGRRLDLATMRGRVVLVDFWSTGCSSCVAAFPKIKQLYEAYHHKGFDVITVSLDDSTRGAQVRSIYAKHELPWHLVYEGGGGADDSPYVSKYQIAGVPAMFLVDQRGRLVASGYLSHRDLEEYLQRLLEDGEKKS